MSKSIADSSSSGFTDLYPVQQRQEWTYSKHTNDFGCIIGHLLVANKKNFEGRVNFQFIPENLAKAGKEEQFSVSKAKSFYYIRDSRVLAPGAVLRSTDTASRSSQIGDIALSRLMKRENFLQTNSGASATSHPSIFQGTQGIGFKSDYFMRTSDGYSQKSRREFYDTLGQEGFATTSVEETIRSTRSYWEGGNVFCCTNSRGELKILIGEESLTLTHMIMRQNQYFRNPDKKTGTYYEETNSTMGAQGDAFNKLYLSGKVPAKVDALAPDLTDGEALQVAEEMAAMGLVKQLDPSLTSQISQIAKNYLGQRKLIAEFLWPEEFRVSAENILLIPQADYHLDTFMKPGPNGSLFVQSYAENLKILSRIKDLADHFGLSQEDREILENYIQETKQLAEDLNPIYEKIYASCEEGGFEVIPTPGAFFGCDTKGNRLNFNFLNAISGYSEANGRYYYITGGVKAGEKLGGLLMEAYTTFLENSVAPFPIQVHYLGYDPDNNSDYSESMLLANGTIRSGIHCLTFELETSESAVTPPAIQ